MSTPDEPKSPVEWKDDGYDIVRLDISENRPDIDPECAADIMKTVQFLLSTGKKSTTTFSQIEKETRLGIRTTRSTVYALESLKYLVVNRNRSGKSFISVDSKLFFGAQIAKKTENCLQELINGANEYPNVMNTVGILPEEAMAHFENNDLRNAIKTYNEAVKKLIKAKIVIFPLVEWKRTAFRIGLGPKFINEFKWR
jgi:hypothetical protein